MGFESLVGPAVGLIGSAIGGGGDQPAGQTTNTGTMEPWKAVQPYLLGSTQRRLKAGVTPTYGAPTQVWLGGTGGGESGGENGGATWGGAGGGSWVTQPGAMTNPESDYETIKTPGVFDEAQSLYSRGGWTPQMQWLVDNQSKQISALRTPQIGTAYSIGGIAATGGYDPNVQRVGNIAGQYGANPQDARAAQGPVDPTTALQRSLSGRVDNPQLQALQNQATNRAMLGYNDAIDTLNNSTLGNIRSGAVMAGGYGGSRQGIAEGLAMQQAAKGAQNLGLASLDSGSAAVANAYENAQNRMAATANSVDARALQAAQFNGSQSMARDQFNANLGLQNNNQEMARAAQTLNNRMTSLQAYNAGNTISDQIYGQQQGLLQQPVAYDQNNLNNYANIILRGAGLGGQQSQSTPYYQNDAAGWGGLASGAMGLLSGGGGGNPFNFGGYSTPGYTGASSVGTYMNPTTAANLGLIQF